jgi:hypothetical protein
VRFRDSAVVCVALACPCFSALLGRLCKSGIRGPGGDRARPSRTHSGVRPARPSTPGTQAQAGRHGSFSNPRCEPPGRSYVGRRHGGCVPFSCSRLRLGVAELSCLLSRWHWTGLGCAAGPLTDPTHDDRASHWQAASSVGQCSVRSLLAGPQDPRGGSFASLGGAALVDNLKPAQATVTQLTFPS